MNVQKFYALIKRLGDNGHVELWGDGDIYIIDKDNQRTKVFNNIDDLIKFLSWLFVDTKKL